jgi:hypothetical protein
MEEELEDLGARFGRDRMFCFDRIVIQEIIFDESNDVTLYCTVPYFGETYGANFGLSFDQLNTLLRSSKPAGESVATVLAEKLEAGTIEVPSVIELEKDFGGPLDISNCILYTTLYDVSGDDDEVDDEDFEDEPNETGDEEEAEYEAYAFLIDEIIIRNGNGSHHHN